MTDIADDIALHRLQVSIELRREPLDKHDQMRRLTGTVLYRDGDSPEAEQIGRLTGWVSRDFDPELLAAAGDSVGPQAGVLTFFAEEIIKAEPGLPFSTVLLVDRMVLDPRWRGHGISPTVLERVLSVLQLDPQEDLDPLQARAARGRREQPARAGPRARHRYGQAAGGRPCRRLPTLETRSRVVAAAGGLLRRLTLRADGAVC